MKKLCLFIALMLLSQVGKTSNFVNDKSISDFTIPVNLFDALKQQVFFGKEGSFSNCPYPSLSLPPISVSSFIIPDTCNLGLGAIDLNVSGGTPPYSFSWSNGANTEDIFGLMGNANYSVTITDVLGETFINSYFVENYIATSIQNFNNMYDFLSLGDNTSCDPNSPNGGLEVYPLTNLPFNWVWSNGVTTASIYNLAAGDYTATVTLGSCQHFVLLAIEDVPDAPILSAFLVFTTCGQPNGAIDLTITGAVPPYTFAWSNGANTEDLTGLTPGNYSVTVTSPNGCSEVGTWPIGDGPSFDLMGDVNPVNSCATPNGAINQTLTPPGSYSFQWSNGETTEDLNNLSPGSFSVTVSDNNNACTVEATYTIADETAFPNVQTVSSAASCGLSNGLVNATASGGVAPYSYQWSNGESTEDIFDVPQGTYTVTVTSANGCSATAAATILDNPITISINGNTSPAPNGAVDISVNPANNYSYNWSNGEASEDLTGLSADLYTVTVSLGTNCSATASFVVEESFPPPIEITAIVVPDTCEGGHGVIDITVSNGTPPYSYEWSNNTYTEDQIGLYPGTYTVTVEDDLGNTATESFVIETINALFEIGIAPTHDTCGIGMGTMTTFVFTGYSPYQFNWSTGETTQNLYHLGQGVYTVTVTDATGCSVTASTYVTEINIIQSVEGIVTPNTSCSANPNGSIALNVQPPGNYVYSWSNGVNTPDQTNLSAGIFTVTVTAYGSCTTIANFIVAQQVNLPTVSLESTPESCNLANGTATTSVSGGEAPYNYQWSNGGTSASLSDLSEGTYSVTVIDENSCTASGNVVVDHVSIAPVINGSISPTTCGYPNGSIALEILPPNNYGFQWSSGQMTQNILSVAAGDYTVTVTVGNCSGTAAFALPNLTIGDTTQVFDITCNPANAGVFEQTYIDDNGCVSLTVTTLSYSAGDTTLLLANTCDTASAGVFVQSLTTSDGCDSLVITTITFSASDTMNIYSTSCDLNDVGTTQQLLTNSNGCDSLIITTITYLASDTTNIYGTSCDLNEVGTSQQLLVNINGCDSLIITTITYSASDTTNMYGTSCDLNDVGITQQLLVNSNGCDSLIITTITYSAADTTNIYGTSCDLNDVGTSQQLLVNSNGCDSLIITTIAYSASDTTNIYGTSCDLNEVGTTQQLLTNINGCDSLIITTITYSAADTTNIYGTSCDLNDVGTSQQLLLNSNGCDSLIITTVTYSASDTTLLSGTSCNPASVGVFTQNLLNANGCDSTVIQTVTYSLSDTTLLTAMSCDPAQTGIFTQNLSTWEGCDSTVITTVGLLPSAATFVTLEGCDPAQVGVFIQNLTTWQGCDSTVTTTVTLLPSVATSLTATTCDAAQAGVFTQNLSTWQGCDSTVTTTVTLLPNATTSLTATTCDPTQAGVFTQNLTTWQGCDSTVTTTVTLLPSATTSLTATTCDAAQAGVFTQNLSTWQGCDSVVTTTVTLLPNANTSLSSTTCDAAQAGVFTQNLTTWQGCDSTVTTTVTWSPPPALALTASDFNGFGVSCESSSDGWAQVSANGVPPFGYLWENGMTNPLLEGLAPGSFAVTTTDGNGCTASASVSLAGPEPLLLSLAVNGLDCFDNNSGGIFAMASGGAMPYAYLLRPVGTTGGNFQPSGSFGGLGAGAYEVVVVDANGCTATELVAVNAPVPPSVELGEDVFIDLGDGTTLEAVASVPWDSLAQVQWSGGGDPECPGCPQWQVQPLVTTAYSITVVDGQGCLASDGLTVYVDRTKSVYVPNAFSPNGDGINDLLLLFAKAGQVKEVKSFLVFDRWGESVYRQFGFQPNDPAIGWDGSHRGEMLNAAVFVWFAEVEFVDGEVVLFEGDVVLVR